MIFFDQFKVPTIKFGKCFVEFMIPIALLKKFEKAILKMDGISLFSQNLGRLK